MPKSVSKEVLTLSQERAYQDDSNDTTQPKCEFQVRFPLLWIRISLDYPYSALKGGCQFFGPFLMGKFVLFRLLASKSID